ncbi:sigma-54-dependent transcriptional regulator [Caldithrix abyssi]
MMKIKVLIVDDDTLLSDEMAAFLSRSGYSVEQAQTLTEARSTVSAFAPDILLLDLKLPDGSGLDLLPEIREKFPQTTIILLSGYGSIPEVVTAIKQGAEDFLTKPLDPDHLLLRLQKVQTHKQLSTRLKILELDWENQRQMIIGQSRKMQEVIKQSQAVAQGNTTVLISGETGTGKHLLAYYIHQNSPRSEAPFVYVNCATLSDQLLESDLFGHEKGAFTGAVRQKEGRVELARGGTLFLDEIGELPITLQAKLLHFIEYGEFQRVGGTKTLRANVRIICATNRNLQQEIEQGRFREDLYFRINVVRVEIPPLRERPEDIPELFDFFLQKFCRELGKPLLNYSPSLREKLLRYPWPGNIRELRNALERAVALCNTWQLSEEDFPFLKSDAPMQEDPLFAPTDLQTALTRFKRRYLQRILQGVNGNQSQAARILHIQRTYLNRLIKELKIETEK